MWSSDLFPNICLIQGAQNEFSREVGDSQTVHSVKWVGVKPPLADNDNSLPAETSPVKSHKPDNRKPVYKSLNVGRSVGRSVCLSFSLTVYRSVYPSVFLVFCDCLMLINTDQITFSSVSHMYFWNVRAYIFLNCFYSIHIKMSCIKNFQGEKTHFDQCGSHDDKYTFYFDGTGQFTDTIPVLGE